MMTAFLMSLFVYPGAGQIYPGVRRKGFVLAALFSVFLLWTIFLFVIDVRQLLPEGPALWDFTLAIQAYQKPPNF